MAGLIVLVLAGGLSCQQLDYTGRWQPLPPVATGGVAADPHSSSHGSSHALVKKHGYYAGYAPHKFDVSMHNLPIKIG